MTSRHRLPLRAERAAFWSTVAAVCVVVVYVFWLTVLAAEAVAR